MTATMHTISENENSAPPKDEVATTTAQHVCGCKCEQTIFENDFEEFASQNGLWGFGECTIPSDDDIMAMREMFVAWHIDTFGHSSTLFYGVKLLNGSPL